MTTIEYVESIDSTNEELKRRVGDGYNERLCLVADEQTAGKGRNGRNFFSPGGSVGVYMSYLYFTNKDISDAVSVTTAASVIAARAVEKATGVKTYIKWVNDLYCNGKKVSGILTELVPTDKGNGIIVGIGINIATKEFPEEIKGKAGAIVDTEDITFIRKTIIEEITKGLDEYITFESLEPYIEEYKSRSCVIGRRVTYSSWDKSIEAFVCDISDKGHLIVRLSNGEKEYLDSGEISIKIENE